MVNLRKDQASNPAGGMTIFGHLAELRMRLVRMMLAVATGSIVILVFTISSFAFLPSPIATYVQRVLILIATERYLLWVQSKACPHACALQVMAA